MPIPNENTHSPAEKPAETALDNKGSFREVTFVILTSARKGRRRHQKVRKPSVFVD
jgi:hypothetical protein